MPVGLFVTMEVLVLKTVKCLICNNIIDENVLSIEVTSQTTLPHTFHKHLIYKDTQQFYYTTLCLYTIFTLELKQKK